MRWALWISFVLAVAGCDRVFQLNNIREAIDAAPDAPPDAASRYAEAVLADSPVAYWRFSEHSLAVAVDETGNGNLGTYQGQATPTADGALVSDPDRAATFDGVGAYVDMSNRLAFTGTAAFSIEAWVQPSGFTTYEGVVCKTDESGGGITRRGYHMYSDGTYFGFDRSDGTAVDDVRTAALQVGRWTYVVVTFDGSALRLYIDGVQAATTTATPAVVIPVTTRPFVVGARQGGLYRFFHGAVDELAVYDRVLSPAQIAAHRLIALGQ